MLKETFLSLLKNYTSDTLLMNEMWQEIAKAYSSKSRHYHSLAHLDNLLTQLNDVKNKISGWNAILFSLYYHDAVYNVLKSNNEEKSALLAEKRMKQLHVDQKMIDACKAQILATKAHLHTTDSDTAYFTDADLSILGAEREQYTNYFQQVRKEYSIYPDLLYNPGRKKVLQHFLNMKRIFNTDHFFEKFEVPARKTWNTN